jgi:hypothetical protein
MRTGTLNAEYRRRGQKTAGASGEIPPQKGSEDTRNRGGTSVACTGIGTTR